MFLSTGILRERERVSLNDVAGIDELFCIRRNKAQIAAVSQIRLYTSNIFFFINIKHI